VRSYNNIHITSGAGGNAVAGNWPGVTVSNVNVGINNSAPAYILDVCGNANITGRLRLYEATGTSTVTSTANTLPTAVAGSGLTGTLIFTHGNSGGHSSILFKSAVNIASDYGYITYMDDVSNESLKERGRLLIGTRDDSTDTTYLDATVLQAFGGYVGIGQLNPAYNLDVSGTIRATGGLVFGVQNV